MNLPPTCHKSKIKNREKEEENNKNSNVNKTVSWYGQPESDVLEVVCEKMAERVPRWLLRRKTGGRGRRESP